MNPTSIGQIDERGYLNGFSKRGYTPPKCLLELVANILDSQDKVSNQKMNRKAIFDVQRTYTKLIDNGFGMNLDAITDMFALHRENHSNDASRGVAGIGAKPSLSILSQKTPLALYTRRMGGDYLCVDVPWDAIHREGKYTGMITLRSMTDTERAEFIRERSDMSMMNGNEYHGTTIRFQTNDLLEEVIRENFEEIEASELQDPLDRIASVFGKESTEFIYKHYERKEPKKLGLYNYFKGQQAEFLTGYSEDSIEQWSTPNGSTHRFIWRKRDGEASEIIKVGKGWSIKPEQSTTNFLGLVHAGNYTVKTGFRIDPAIFDPEAPALPENEVQYGATVEQFLGTSPLNREYVASNKLYRNKQILGILHPELTIANARANAETNFEFHLVQCEVYFNPISSQDNLQDRAMGTQENKNQFNPTGPPKNFLRLVKAIRHAKFVDIWAAMKQSIPVAAGVEEEVEEEELDEVAPPPPVRTGALDTYIQIKKEPPPLPPSPASSVSESSDEETEIAMERPPPQLGGGVRGEELRRRITQLHEVIQSNTWYTDAHYVEIYRLIDTLLH